MTNRLVGLAGLVVTVVVVSSRPAEANIWDVLEALSGPGAFHARPINVLATRCRDGFGARTVVEPKVPCFYFDFRPLESPADERFFKVTTEIYEFGASFRVQPAIEIGGGMGWIHFDSNRVSTTRFTVTPARVVVKPLMLLPRLQGTRWLGLLKYYVKETVIVGRLQGEDFGVSNAVFREKNAFDIVTSAGFIIDVGELIGAR